MYRGAQNVGLRHLHGRVRHLVLELMSMESPFLLPLTERIAVLDIASRY